MRMTPSIRKLALTAHIIASIGWVGALAVFLVHAIAGLISDDQDVVRAVSLAMALTAWLVIMPLSVATLITGLVQAFGTAWGLVRHYWILFKLLLAVLAAGVLLLKLEPISHLADAARNPAFSSGDLVGLRTSLTIHAAGGLLVLLAAAMLAIYKPAGLTPYGARKEGAQHAARAPSWAKISGIILAAFLLPVAVMALFGAHRPRAHLS